MKENRDYIHDIAAMRSMMERSTKFLSLSGLAGILCGVYALAGAFIAYSVLDFNPGKEVFSSINNSDDNLPQLGLLAMAVLLLAVGTAIYLSHRKAVKRKERSWNASSRRLIANMAVPLVTGGILVVVLAKWDMTGWLAPFTLIFYGLSLYNASRFTYEELRSLGLVMVLLGLTGCWFPQYGLLLWAAGFGLAHIVYGIYMYSRYER